MENKEKGKDGGVANVELEKKPIESTSAPGKERVLHGKDQTSSVEAEVATGTKRKSTGAIAIKLCPKPKDSNETLVKEKKSKLSSVFNDDSESEEEMPLECKMKMRNIGRDTSTSSGPKSFNKGKKGFTKNSFKVFELSMKPRNNMEKQTVYEQK